MTTAQSLALLVIAIILTILVLHGLVGDRVQAAATRAPVWSPAPYAPPWTRAPTPSPAPTWTRRPAVRWAVTATPGPTPTRTSIYYGPTMSAPWPTAAPVP